MKRILAACLALSALVTAQCAAAADLVARAALQGAARAARRSLITGPASISAPMAAAAGAIPGGTPTRPAISLSGGQAGGTPATIFSSASRVRRRRRCRLVRLERQQHVAGLCRRLQHQRQLAFDRARPRRLCVRPGHALCHRRPRGRRHSCRRTGLRRRQCRPMPAGRLAPALKSRCPATGAPRRNILRVDLGSFNCTGCGALPPDNVSLQENVFRAGVNYHFGWGK